MDDGTRSRKRWNRACFRSPIVEGGMPAGQYPAVHRGKDQRTTDQYDQR